MQFSGDGRVLWSRKYKWDWKIHNQHCNHDFHINTAHIAEKEHNLSLVIAWCTRMGNPYANWCTLPSAPKAPCIVTTVSSVRKLNYGTLPVTILPWDLMMDKSQVTMLTNHGIIYSTAQLQLHYTMRELAWFHATSVVVSVDRYLCSTFTYSTRMWNHVIIPCIIVKPRMWNNLWAACGNTRHERVSFITQQYSPTLETGDPAVPSKG